MPQNATTGPFGLAICGSPGVLAWIAKPHAQRNLCRKIQLRIDYVFSRIEDTGRRAGTDFIHQIDLPLDPPLLEVKVVSKNFAFRIFGVNVGKRLCLSEVKLKKKQAYSSAEYKALHSRAKSFAQGQCLEQAIENTQ